MSKPGLTLHRLELFLSVLDAGGIGRAAQARRVSQPAVSEHLRGLEAFFGVPLFERAGRGVRPTAAARLIEPFVRQALGLVTSAAQAAVELRGLRAGTAAVGASTTPGTYLLPQVLGRFHAAHPQIALTLRIGDTREVEQWVAAGAVEIGVIGATPLRPGLAAETWVQDELVAIVARRHTLAHRRTIAAAALAAEPYISREEGSSTRAVGDHFFAEAGVTLRPVMQLGSTEAVREAVAAGLGVSVVSRHAVRARDPRVVAIRLQGRQWVRDLLVIRRDGAPLSPAGARLREMLLRSA
jgi:DNA-binding transcriptional LysR family regulator